MLLAPISQLAAAALALGCPSNAASRLELPQGTSQAITVEAASTRTTYAALRIWRRSGRCWAAAGGPFPARVGWNGVRRDRHEGDGTTPIGTFRIAATMYGNEPNPGVSFRYRRVGCGDWWVEDASSPAYNTFQRVGCGIRPPFRVTTPDLSQDRTAYPYFAVVEFNLRPVVPGRGSGIFLHAQTGRPTNGCISLPRTDLLRVLRW
nr:L,D-transpeptidase family protein [Actinomycetota bacterium]